ncbi:uncharacterized protein LOC132201720 isoform X2 [Neocloeon triangulifer]|uniref:uncharacterized protein LOC132201720 isoform X2 n=1 Tax=Neocloeon triangulifer TaxID=2078957 RepID=UPI00286EF85B|nr:uncharacterized protein LOC132201720 isoform X2 [Neocloeon triangulifer]XP_059484143.1 uncharacterized protein LOC132201720 isoform X2 [Neocloeon triangulifer]
MRSLILVTLISTAFAAVLVQPERKEPLDNVAGVETKDLATDVAVARIYLIDLMRDLHTRKQLQTELHYLIIVDVGNKLQNIQNLLEQTGISSDVINEILATITINFNTYLSSYNLFTSGFDVIRQEILNVNNDLYLLDSTLSGSYVRLQSAILADENIYYTVKNNVDTLLQSGEQSILTAIEGLFNQEVIDINVAIQEIKGLVGAKQKDLADEHLLFNSIAQLTLSSVKTLNT